MTDRRDVNLMLAQWIQWNTSGEGEKVGLDDNHLFFMVDGKVFRIKVEEITQLTTPEHAKNFMATLPYGPE